jgi:hypothetical protein
MAVRPGAPVVEADPVAQKQLAQPVPAAHQIHAHRLACAHEVAQRLLPGPRHPDRVQPDQVLGVAAVGLDPLPGRARDLARRRHHALHAAPGKLARQPVARRPGLIGRAHRPRQPGAQPGRRADVAADPKPLHLARLGIEHRRHDLGGVHIQTDEASSLRHGRFLLCACGPPRGYQPRDKNVTPQPTWGTGPFYNRGRTDAPYGLVRSASGRHDYAVSADIVGPQRSTSPSAGAPEPPSAPSEKRARMTSLAP